MNHTVSAVVGASVLASATVGYWVMSKWRNNRANQARIKQLKTLADALQSDPFEGNIINSFSK